VLVVSDVRSFLDLFSRGGRDLKQAQYLLEKPNPNELEYRLIPEPQRGHVLDLLRASGPTGDAFVLASAQAMKFGVVSIPIAGHVPTVSVVISIPMARYTGRSG
jgi:hypothetical protein